MIPVLAWKIGGPILGAAIMYGALQSCEEGLRKEGDARTEAKYAEQREEQQEDVREVERQQHEEKVASLERLIDEKDRFNAQFAQRARAKDQELKRLQAYVQATKHQQPEVLHEVHQVEVPIEIPVEVIQEVETPCVVDDDLVRDVNFYTGMLNAIPRNRLPADGAAVGGAAVQGPGPVTCTTLVERIGVLAHRLGNALIEFRELTEFYDNQYAINQAFFEEHGHE